MRLLFLLPAALLASGASAQTTIATDGELTLVRHYSDLSHSVLVQDAMGLTVSELVSPHAGGSPLDTLDFGRTGAVGGGVAVVGHLADFGPSVAFVYDAATGELRHTLRASYQVDSAGIPDLFGFTLATDGRYVAATVPGANGQTHPGTYEVYEAATGHLLARETLGLGFAPDMAIVGDELVVSGESIVDGSPLTQRFTLPPLSVPEPGTLGLALAGLLVGARRRA